MWNVGHVMNSALQLCLRRGKGAGLPGTDAGSNLYRLVKRLLNVPFETILPYPLDSRAHSVSVQSHLGHSYCKAFVMSDRGHV